MRKIGVMLIGLFMLSVLSAQEKGPKRPVPVAELWRELERGLESNDYARMLKATNRLLPIYPKDPFLWWAKGTAIVHLAKNSKNWDMLQEAQSAFEKAVQIDENYLDAYIGKAVVLSLLGQDEIARIEMKSAVARGYPVREIQENDVLVKYLYDPPFFLELLDKERIYRITLKRDPFRCPIKRLKKEQPSKVPSIPFHEQRAMVVLLKRAMKKLFNSIKQNDWQSAMIDYEQFLKQKEETLKKVVIATLKIEVQKIIEAVEKKKAEIKRIKRDWLCKNAQSLLTKYEKAINDKQLKEAERIQGELNTLFARLEGEKDPQTLRLIEKYKEQANVLARRASVLKEFLEKILPILRLTGILEEVVGENVKWRAALIEVSGQTEVVEEGRNVRGVKGLRLIRVIKEEETVKLIYKGESVELKMTVSGK